MVMKYCPLKKCLNYCSSCKNGNDKFYLEDKFGNRCPMVRNNCITHIMHHSVLDKIDGLNVYKEMGINHYRIELFDENSDEVRNIIDRFNKKLSKN